MSTPRIEMPSPSPLPAVGEPGQFIGSSLGHDPWRLVETSWDPTCNLLRETLFALGNGHIGLRGSHDEAWAGKAADSMEGTYVNGFYDTETICYPENAYGFARVNEFMLNIPNAKGAEISINGEWFNLADGEIEAYQRSLDFRAGVLVRKVVWKAPSGKRVRILSQRLVSFSRRAVFAQRISVTPLDRDVLLSFNLTIDSNVRGAEESFDPRLGSAAAAKALSTIETSVSPGRLMLTARTRNSDLLLRIESLASLSGGVGVENAAREDNGVLAQHFRVAARAGETVTVDRTTAILTTRDVPADRLAAACETALGQARATGFDGLVREQRASLAGFWKAADIEIEGADALSQGLHFSLFHLFQSAGRDGYTNIAAKGLTGEGYEGHSFWDTEIYILPVFTRTFPKLARALLCHRISYLDSARARARDLGHARGALYPWRTIAGEECSSYFPAGTAQYHINADIAFAFKQYIAATGDVSLLLAGAAEVVFETARIWSDLAHEVEGRYHIDEVTGPDEYSALVNNNLYTNVMAATHLAFAVEIAERLQREEPAFYAALSKEVGLSAAELSRWTDVAARIALPYDAARGIHAQDDAFLSRKVWDFDNTPPENYPLLLHYHPLVIYRHQVCKQADVLLALFLRGELFSRAEKWRDFNYYEAITTHDSSLSSCIHSIIASEVGKHDLAYAFFMETARMDIDNTHDNTFHGVHTASMGGSWMCVAHGFAGLRVVNGDLHFTPHLPGSWSTYRFRLVDHGQTLQVSVSATAVEYRLVEGAALRLFHRGMAVYLSAAEPVRVVGLPPAFEKKHFRAVIFDLDGVITDTARYHHRAWKRLADELNIDFDEAFAENLKGIDRRASLQMILDRGNVAVDGAEFEHLCEMKNDWYRELIGSMTRDDLLPGAFEALKAVRNAGLRIGLASVSRNAPTILERLGITDMFDTVVDAGLLKRGKPDPEIFLKAAADLGVDPEDCLGVEDAASGVAAIKAAGMAALGIGNPSVLGQADAVISGLDDFILDEYLFEAPIEQASGHR
ncbi:beta-phosphoglucomutase [Martelella lutilitoris]|uniref:Beta-phosphoglucomutase n=1 Tax=Martelella lutilitoris TaxID=2583532 RepID=A0A5C4JLT4_9HYPH|nr:beta-phosphoglucomutase [Martelella lutilitoris]TNB46250.1 beta-phosphoglucomutase [Martelella lutilitoris]